ncbi:copper amine oxidase [Candidatus Peregrinibacteria bacterium]|nr:copper amine oxidase [Candidatus Peregrinibacteria bacterium]
MNLRKFLATIVMGILLIGALPAVSTAASFSDVSSDDFSYDAIYYLKSNDIVEGYSDGTYKPDSTINRAEFLKILTLVSSVAPSGKNCYPDVKDVWYSPYVCAATEAGWVAGYPDGYFRPEKEINFVEASKIISNALDLELEDADTLIWFKHYVTALDDEFAIPPSVTSFDKKITRAEMAEMIYRLDASVHNRVANTYNNIATGVSEADVWNEMRTFDDCDSLLTYLEPEERTYYGYDDDVMVDAVEESAEAPKSTSDTQTAPAPGGAEMGTAAGTEYSTTNVQVEGVDEADIVKTDGENIYIVKGDNVRVVKAYPADEMTELGEVTFDDEGFFPYDMYVDGPRNRLTVIGTSYNDSIEPYNVTREYDYDYYGTTSKVYVFDISDASNIELMRQVSFEGDYVSSRKVDEMVYLVSNKYYYYYNPPILEDDVIPLYGDSATGEVKPVTTCGDIRYIPGGIDKTYLIVSGIPTDDEKGAVTEEVVLGSSGEIYASRDNLYLAEYGSSWYYWDSAYNEETVVHKFSLDRSDIEYEGQGAVPGTILNQFSMDEYDGNFRIATTLGDVWSSNPPATNNVYVLDENMDTVGLLEGLAPGESIYSVRFMGEKAYMVTFKKVDPLFVIDLSNPSSPSVLGKLKIPGYSDYLHPYDENHIIGFGKEAVEASEEDVASRDLDFAWYQGMKVAMFDVSDVENPVELHKMVIGDRGTESELLWTHKALLFDKEKGLMAFPVTLAEISDEVKNDPDTPDNTYGDFVYQGAYVYDVSVEDGFNLRGRITHYNESEVEEKSGYYWYGEKDIERILYIGENLYTVSLGMVKANLLSNLDEVNEVEVGGESGYGDYWYE